MPTTTLFTAMAPFDDPWHNFDATSDELARILEARGHTVLRPASLGDVAAAVDQAELLVVNVSADQFETAEPFTDFAEALERLLARGGAILAMHASLLAFQENPRWAELIGVRWNHPVSMHPQKGWALVQVGDAESPITAGIEAFTIYDEKYARLDSDPTNETLLLHTLEGVRHPLLWTREHGASRVVVDALGHGVESFDNATHRELIERSLDWLLPADARA